MLLESLCSAMGHTSPVKQVHPCTVRLLLEKLAQMVHMAKGRLPILTLVFDISQHTCQMAQRQLCPVLLQYPNGSVPIASTQCRATVAVIRELQKLTKQLNCKCTNAPCSYKQTAALHTKIAIIVHNGVTHLTMPLISKPGHPKPKRFPCPF